MKTKAIAAVREAADAFKPFPRAVATLIHLASDHGATEIEMIFRDTASGTSGPERSLELFWNGRGMTREEVDAALQSVQSRDIRPETRWILAAVHHADALVIDVSAGSKTIRLPALASASSAGGWREPVPTQWAQRVRLRGLGTGDGVNASQNRTAESLRIELPFLLSPREISRVRLVEPGGCRVPLVPVDRGHSKDVGDYTVCWPSRLVDKTTVARGDGLTIKCGTVRVPVSVAFATLRKGLRQELSGLESTWAAGVIEILPRSPKTKVESLTMTAIAKLLAASGIEREVCGQMADYCCALLFPKQVWSIRFRDEPVQIHPSVEHHDPRHAVWVVEEYRLGGCLLVRFDPSRPIFQVDSNVAAFTERLWWQVAKLFWERAGRKGELDDFYLELRAAIKVERGF